MKISEALTFDDVLIVPSESNILPSEVDTKTKITNDITLNIPLISSAMDTVTEERMAISMAQAGGLGVIHRNLSIEQQAAAVAKVKRFESGVINSPITLKIGQTLKSAKLLQKKYNITGFPVVDKKNKLVGIVTNRDMRFAQNDEIPVEEMMTSKKLAVLRKPFEVKDAKKLMSERRIEKLLVVDKNNKLTGLMTIKDLEKAVLHPLASKDELGRLMVAGASTVGEKGFERSQALISSGADIIVIDTSHGHSTYVINAVKNLKKSYPSVQLIAGNVATADATKALIDAGADAIKVGIGPGSICTTRIVAGVGVPQLSAILNCAKISIKNNIPIIADGGIKFSGDFAKAIAAGASCAMVGSMLAGTDEAPGELILYQGRSYKSYRGMGSLGAMARGSADRYFQQEVENEKLVPEGVEGQVAYKGPAINVIHQLTGGLKAAMGYTGNKNINQMMTSTQFIRITNAGLSESHVHDVRITREPLNYRLGV